MFLRNSFSLVSSIFFCFSLQTNLFSHDIGQSAPVVQEKLIVEHQGDDGQSQLDSKKSELSVQDPEMALDAMLSNFMKQFEQPAGFGTDAKAEQNQEQGLAGSQAAGEKQGEDFLALLMSKLQSSGQGVVDPMGQAQSPLDSLANLLRPGRNEEILKQRKIVFEQLPADIKRLVEKALDNYSDFAANVQVENGMTSLCEKIRAHLVHISDEKLMQDPLFSKLSLTLERLHTALINGAFKQVITGSLSQGNVPTMPTSLGSLVGDPFAGLAALFGNKGPIEPFELDAVASLLADIAAWKTMTKENGQVVAFNKQLSILESFLQAIVDKKGEVLMDLFFAYLQPLFANVQGQLDEVFNRMDQELKKLPENTTQVALKKALEYWRRDIQKKQRTLKVFSFFKQDAERSSYHTLFKITAYTYDIFYSFFDVHKNYCLKERDPRLWAQGDYWWQGEYFKKFMLPDLSDHALRAAITSLFFFNMRADQSKGMMKNIFMGKESVASMDNPSATLMYNFSLMPFALPAFFIRPSFALKRPHEVLRSYGNVIATWIYYQFFQNHLFGEPTEKVFFKKALIFAMYQTNKSLFDIISLKIRDNMDPYLLEKVENKTWGVIRPEMFSFIVEALIPTFFLNCAPHDRLANFTQADFYGDYFIRMAAQKRLTPDQTDKWHIEQCVIDYIMRSVGGHWGRIIAIKNKPRITRLLNTAYDAGSMFLEICGVWDEGQAEEAKVYKEEVTGALQESTFLLKQLIGEVFRPGSGYRQYVTSFLTTYGYLDKDEINVKKINEKIIRFALFQMARYHIISYFDATVTLRMYEEAPNRLDKVIDKVIESLSNSIIGLGGEWTGKWLMSYIGMKISDSYGPFYPKVQGWFA